MKLIKNSGNDRVVDALREVLGTESSLDVASPAFSLFAFAEVRSLLEKVAHCRLVLPTTQARSLLGLEADRPFSNRLQVRWLARQCAEWINKKADVRGAPAFLPQSTLITGHKDSGPRRVITGNCPFTTAGLGLTPGNQFSLIQCSELRGVDVIKFLVCCSLGSLPSSSDAQSALTGRLQDLMNHKAPSLIYDVILFNLFRGRGDELDEERVIKSATASATQLSGKALQVSA